MIKRFDRKITISLLSILMIIPGLMLSVASDHEIETGTRSSDSGFIAKDDFYIQPEYNVEDLWVVVWMERSERIERNVPGTEHFFFFREVANSFAFPVDGSIRDTGTDRHALVELFTSVTCVFCPGSEGALDLLAKERLPDDFSLIEWHTGDGYQTTSALGRYGGYNVSGTPTVFFDGMTAQVGGDTNPNNKQLPVDYGKKIDRAIMEQPYVSFAGSASTSGNYLEYNITFDVINPMPRGNWRLYAIIVEDINKDHNGAKMRFIPRGSINSRSLDTLQEGFPDITIDEDETFNGLDRNKIRNDFNIYWNATDTEDGSNLEIDIYYRSQGTAWKILETELPNTGYYSWDTTDPRVDDGTYQLRLVATDTDGNSILSGNFILFTIDNPDPPTGIIIFPGSGDSLSKLETIEWDSDDDEDGDMGLMARVSISNDTGLTWKVISYNQITEGDWIQNMGELKLNTLNYDDLSTYVIKVELKDSDGMITDLISDRFEIYNNDRPTATLISPSSGDVISGELIIEWKVTDEEDMPSEMYGNFSVRKGDGRWQILFEGPMDDEMADKSFSTGSLSGDGEYTLMFTVTDSRGLNHSSSTIFSVYDPDAPVFHSINGPTDPTDIRKDIITLTWECSDADIGETILYSVFIAYDNEDNWTEIATDISGITYDLTLAGLDQGYYEVKVLATDSSPLGLTDEIFFGPFYYNAPDPPEIFSTSHPEGLTGEFPQDVNETLKAGEFNLEIRWDSNDEDGDAVTYSIHYSTDPDGDWILLRENMSTGSYNWNLTDLPGGEYLIRIMGTDSSPHHLTSRIILGPILWTNVFEEDEEGASNDDSNIDVGEDEDANEGPNWQMLVIIGLISVVLIVIVVLISIFFVSRFGRHKTRTDVIPSEDSMDFNSIPSFERAGPAVTPVFQPQSSAPAPKQYSHQAVNWEETDENDEDTLTGGTIGSEDIIEQEENESHPEGIQQSDLEKGETIDAPPQPPM